MPEDQYFRPRNWTKFQSKSNNSLAWIKLQTSLLDDPQFMGMTPVNRYAWVALLLLCGRAGRPLPLSCGFAGRVLGLSLQQARAALDTFKANNFIELCDRTSNLYDELRSLDYIEDIERVDKKERAAKAAPKKAARQGSRLPDDWEPCQADLIYARERGFDEASIGDITANFKTHWTAGNGRNKTHIRWSGGNGAWGTWVRNQRQPAKRESSDSERERVQRGLAAAVHERMAAGIRPDAATGNGAERSVDMGAQVPPGKLNGCGEAAGPDPDDVQSPGELGERGRILP